MPLTLKGDPVQIHPDTSILDILEDSNAGTLPGFGHSVTVASRGNVSDYLEYLYEGRNPVWCLGIFYFKQKQVSAQSIACRMLIGGMSVSEVTLDYNTNSYAVYSQSRYLNPVLLLPNTKVTLGIWNAYSGSKITNLDGSCEIRLFDRS